MVRPSKQQDEDDRRWDVLKRKHQLSRVDSVYSCLRPVQVAFLCAYSIYGNTTQSCGFAGVDRTTFYQWMRRDPNFPEAFEAAKEDFADSLEQTAVRLARDGLKRYKFYQGVVIRDPVTNEPYYEMEFQPRLLEFLLKGARPEKYREQTTVIQTTGVQIQQLQQDVQDMDGTILPPAELVKKLTSVNVVNQNGNGHKPHSGQKPGTESQL